jgi:hypothetical protein
VARKVAPSTQQKGKGRAAAGSDSEDHCDDEQLEDAYEDAQEFFVTAGTSSKTSDNTFR